MPSEIWARIVKIAVTRKIQPWQCESWDPIDFGVPPIARTCRAIRAEALKSFHLYNTFEIHGSCDDRDLTTSQQWIERRIEEGHWGMANTVFVKICCIPGFVVKDIFKERFRPRKTTLRSVEPASTLYELHVESWDELVQESEDEEDEEEGCSEDADGVADGASESESEASSAEQEKDDDCGDAVQRD